MRAKIRLCHAQSDQGFRFSLKVSFAAIKCKIEFKMSISDLIRYGGLIVLSLFSCIHLGIFFRVRAIMISSSILMILPDFRTFNSCREFIFYLSAVFIKFILIDCRHVNPWLQQTTNFATSFLVFIKNKV